LLKFITALSAWLIPILFLIIISMGLIKKINLYEEFVEGAKEGFGTSVSLIPHLVGMMVAITVFRDSGLLDFLINIFASLFNFLNVPVEILPMAFLRPITGSGSLAMMSQLIEQYGPDSYIGRLVSTIQGSTDTTLYIITVYYGAIGIKKVGYSLKVGLLSDLVGIIASIVTVNLFF